MEGSVRTRALQFQRFTRLNRALHVLMIVSFISLALTGMTLKFSYTGWAAFLARRLGGYEGAGFIHRAAATLMFGLFAIHLWDLNRKRKEEHGGSLLKLVLGPDSLLFNRRDLRELVGSLKWFVGKGPRPQLRALDVLGEVRLLRRLLGDLRDRLDRAHAVVPGLLHEVPARAG